MNKTHGGALDELKRLGIVESEKTFMLRGASLAGMTLKNFAVRTGAASVALTGPAQGLAKV